MDYENEELKAASELVNRLSVELENAAPADKPKKKAAYEAALAKQREIVLALAGGQG